MNFSIGDVVNRTLGSTQRNFGVFFALSAILVGAPAFVLGLAQGDPTAASGALAIASGVALLVNLVTAYILQGAITRGAIVDFNGGRANFGDCLRTGVRHAAPLFAIAILISIGTMLGVVLLVVPGIILAIMWAVAVPAHVVENVGITRSLGRSRELTKGARWKLFWLFLVFAVVAVLVTMVATVPMSFLAGSPLIFALFNVVVTMLISVIGAVGASAIYYELRSKKEGVGAEQLAKVFD
jgi:uncharacterized membrane protein